MLSLVLEKNRTTDALFIIQTISLIATKRRGPLFLGFIDLAKAFHDLLWFKLSTIGISTRMIFLTDSQSRPPEEKPGEHCELTHRRYDSIGYC